MTFPADEPSAEAEALRREIAKLRKINSVLMERVERSTDWQGSAYSMFQAAIVLEGRVEERSIQLESALRQLEAVNHDLSHAKEEADTARQRLQEAIESISEGFALFDADDRLLLWNRNYVDLLFVLGQDVVAGTRFAQVIRAAVAHGVIRDATGREDQWIAERMAYHHHPDRAFVYRLTDGRWVQVNERRTHDGGTVAIYTDITDIKLTEQRRRERELAEKSALLVATLESLSQGVAVFDRNLRLAAWNQRYLDIHNFPPDLARAGTPYADFLRCNARRGEYGTGDPDDLVARRLEAASLRLPRSFERELADGRVVEIASSPMPDGGFVNTYTDITERQRADLRLRQSEKRLKALAQDLQQANETLERRVGQRTGELQAANAALSEAKVAAEQANLSKTKFLAAASHDLHQPLNAARLFAATLAEQEEMTGRSRELIKGVDGSLESIDGLLRALFEISKLDAGVVAADIRTVPVGPILDQLKREYCPQARDAGLCLTVMPCTLAVRSDPQQLTRILWNFLSNALRYTERGRILVGCRRRGDQLELQVWDTGPGIPEHKVPEIFQEFQQIALPGRRREKGLGLGLAIVERIARRLDHSIKVRSRVGQGSCFSVLLPVVGSAGPEPVPEQPQAEPMAAGSLAGVEVLVIDDDPSGLEAIVGLLSAWKCRVTAVASGQELAGHLAGRPRAPHLVIADYHLGDDTNGLDAIGCIRARYGSPVPAFLVSSDRAPELRAAAAAHGLSLLSKPIPPLKLRSLMSHLMWNSRG